MDGLCLVGKGVEHLWQMYGWLEAQWTERFSQYEIEKVWIGGRGATTVWR